MKLSTKQKLFFDAAIAGRNIFLTGEAGTGKSHVVKLAIEALQKKRRNVVVLAPTGIAANNIGGQTIHSMFSLRPFGVLDYDACHFLKSEKRRMMGKIDTIIIDEVSMLRPDLLDGINWTLLKNGCKGLDKMQLILVGDLEQLEAPMDDNMRSVLLASYNGVEFFNAGIWGKVNSMTIELDEVLRQSDEEFIHHLNIIRKGKKSEYFRQFANLEQRGIVLAPLNSTVAAYNAAGLAAHTGNEYVFDAIVEGNLKASDFNLESQITVKHGCKIMYLVNSRNNNLINGTLGIFEADGTNYFINVAGVRYALDKVEKKKVEYVLNETKDALELRELGSITQYPFRLAYALTIHKAQGLTFDEITLDLTRPCFTKGQMYTALSRVRSPNGLTIITK